MLQSCMVMYGLYANDIKVKDKLKSMRQPCGNMPASHMPSESSGYRCRQTMLQESQLFDFLN